MTCSRNPLRPPLESSGRTNRRAVERFPAGGTCEAAQISNQTTVSPPAVFFHDNGTPQVEDRKKDSRVCRCAGPLASWWKLSATSMYQYQPTIETSAAATTGPATSSMKLMQRRMWLRCSRGHLSPLAYLATRWMPVPSRRLGPAKWLRCHRQ